MKNRFFKFIKMYIPLFLADIVLIIGLILSKTIWGNKDLLGIDRKTGDERQGTVLCLVKETSIHDTTEPSPCVSWLDCNSDIGVTLMLGVFFCFVSCIFSAITSSLNEKR